MNIKEKCPNCSSYKTQSLSYKSYAAIMLIVSSILIWIPVIGWFLLPITLLSSLVLFIFSFKVKEINHICKECSYKWKTEIKKEAKEN